MRIHGKYLQINGHNIPYPDDMTIPSREIVKAAEITTMSGKRYADVVGWRYQDTTLKWSLLKEDDLNTLLDEINSEFQITFEDPKAGSVTETVTLNSVGYMGTRIVRNGNILWKDIEFSIEFPDCHAL